MIGAHPRTGDRTRVTRILLAFVLFGATAIVLGVEARLRPEFGAAGRYYDGTTWSGHVRVRTTDSELTTETLRVNWPWRDEPFSVRWDGWLLVSEDATYRFGSMSDDGSWVYVDEELVVDNGGRHEGRMAVGQRRLSEGLHRVRVDYFEAGGGAELAVLWAREGEVLHVLTGPTLLAVEPTNGHIRNWSRAVKVRDVLIAASAMVYAIAFITLLVVRPLRWLVRRELPDRLPRAAAVVLLAFVCLALAGIWWGLPGKGWAPDEVTPGDLATALDVRFSGGWTSKYPPGHYQIAIAASLPLWALRASDPTTFSPHAGGLAVFLIARLLSLVMAVGTVVILYLCARRVLARAGAFFAVAVWALTPPWVYYAKLANLDAPYLFWSAVSLLAFARIFDEDDPLDLLIYAGAATMAICTKDQAYGLFILPTIAILVRRWQRSHPLEAGESAIARMKAAILGPPVLAAGGLALALFILSHNLIWNADGFVAHLRSITGADSRNFRVFDPGLAGQWAMFTTSLRILVGMLGWIASALAAAGLILSAWHPDRRVAGLWWIAMSPLSYYVTFIAIVGYNYDRFLLPVAIVPALFAGFAVDTLLSRGDWGRRAAVAAMSLALAHSAVRAALVDVALTRDSRYQVEKWLRAHADPAETIGAFGLIEYLPRLEGFRVAWLSPSRDELAMVKARHVVVNRDFAARFAPGSEQDAAYKELASSTGPYREVLSVRTRLPLEALSYQADLVRIGDSFTNLTKINPAIVVYERLQK